MATLGDPAAIRLLVSAGARTDAQDNAGNTPLHEAVLSRQAVAVEALLQAGANRELKNLEGFTPADIAARDGYGPTAAALARM